MITEEELLGYLVNSYTIWDIMKETKYSKNTVRFYLNKYNINTPKGFYYTGKQRGRAKGSTLPQSQILFMSETFSGSGNPFYGKKHTDATKLKMSQNHADFLGDKNPLKNKLKNNPELHRVLSEAARERWAGRSSEEMEVISQTFSKAIAESGYFNDSKFHKNHDAGYIATVKCGKELVFCRSAWEKQVCGFLDSNILVLSFDLEPHCILYCNEENKLRYSRVDFLVVMVNSRQLMIEVKPKGLWNIGTNPYKIEGYRKHCLENGIQFALIGKEYMSQENFDPLIQKAFDGELYVK